MEFKPSWIEKMRAIDLNAPAPNRITEQPESKPTPLLRDSWIEKLHRLVAEQAAQDADPWHARLARLRGTVGIDNVERITTQQVLDVLEITQRERSGGAAGRRLAKIMTEIGWTATRVRGLRRGVNTERIRGYARCSNASPARRLD